MSENQNSDFSDKPKESFSTYYQRRIVPLVKTFEKNWQYCRKKSSIWGWITVILLFLSIIAFLACIAVPQYHAIILKTTNLFQPIMKSISVFLGLSFLFFVVLLRYCKYSGYIYNVQEHIKTQILNEILSFAGNFKVSTEESTTDCKNIAILGGDTVEIKDSIVGYYKNLKITIEELYTSTTDDKKPKSEREHSFWGILITLKNINRTKELVVVGNRSLWESTNLQESNIQLEDKDFHNTYAIHANSQVEARYIVTPSLMERLKYLHKRGIILTLCFQDNNLYIAMDSKGQDYFDINTKDSLLDFNQYKRILYQITDIIAIIDTLKLEDNLGL